MFRLAVFLLLGLAMLQTGCASREDVQVLEAQLKQTQKDAAKRIQQLEQQLAETRTRLQEQIAQSSNPMRAAQANIWSDLEQTRNRLSSLEGRVDAAERVLGEVESQGDKQQAILKRMAFETQAMRMALTSELGVDLPEPPAEGLDNATAPFAPGEARPANATAGNATASRAKKPSPPPEPEPEEQADPAKALYDTAMENFKARKYDKARRLWAEFAENFPKHYLAPNAWFWQGECHYQQQRYAQAVLAYQNVLDRYPKSAKFKTALLKQGITWFKLGKPKAGRLRLEELVESFPKTPEAKRARAFLDKQ
jgi:tol-pal system protein YbgF